MIKARYQKYELHFKQPAGTSRGVLKTRTVWYFFLKKNGVAGIGECAPLPGLSIETPEQIEEQLEKICNDPQAFISNIKLLQDFPSLKFAVESAILDLQNDGKRKPFPSEFTRGEAGIPINGLIWMNEIENMHHQIEEKLAAGFRCIKLKIGAKDFEQELELLKAVREHFSNDQIILRVDANGAFDTHSAPEKLKRLSGLQLHSIEQPIRAGQWTEMAELCKTSPLPIALDEELIGINKREEKAQLLDQIRPQFLVLKPSLHGGISGCDEWIELANERSIGWWITSYLESNIGLNAIAQWAFTKNTTMHQGLGTGQLFTNNIDSPLEIRGEKLWFNTAKSFEM